MIRVGEGRVRTKAMDGDAVELAKFAQYGNLRLSCSLERVPAAYVILALMSTCPRCRHPHKYTEKDAVQAR